MPDLAARQPVLDARRLAAGAHDNVQLECLPPCAHFVFRGGHAAAGGAGEAFGAPLPLTACRAAQSEHRAALWLGPDEWLLLAPASDEMAVAHAIAQALGDTPHALVNAGHRQVVLRLRGPRACDVLNAGCPLDMHEAAFPTGMCTRTVLAKAQIVLWRQDTDMFDVVVFRSFAAYVWDFLLEAAARL